MNIDEEVALIERKIKAYENKKRYNLVNQKINQLKRLYSAAKSRAKKSGLEFTIDITDLDLPEVCPYLNIPLTNNGREDSSVRTNASLDRIDSSKGYIKGNVQIISYQANAMKQNSSIEDLVTFAKNVLKLHQ